MPSSEVRRQLEDAFVMQFVYHGLPLPEREYRFCPDRKWRADFAYPELHLLIEIEGGTWINGGHSRGAAMARDMEKYNAAALLGYRLLRFDNHMVEDGRALATIKQALEGTTDNENHTA